MLAAHPLVAAAVPACALLVFAHVRRRRRDAATLLCQSCDEQYGIPAGDPPQKLLGHEPPRSPQVSTPSTSTGVRTKTRLAGSDAFVGLTKDKASTTRRDGYIDWHDYFMSVAMLSAFRSKDPNRQVGACIVDPSTKRIVGIGYNGFPWGCSDDELPWARKADSWLDTKYPYVCHAEMNAIMNKNTASLEGCRMYTTLFPCNECAKLITQARIREVVYLSDAQRDTDPNTAARRIFNMSGVDARQHTPAAGRVVIDFEDELAK